MNVYLLCGNLTDAMKRVDLIWDKDATYYTMDHTILNYRKMHKEYRKSNKRMCKDKIQGKSSKYTFSVTYYGSIARGMSNFKQYLLSNE